MLFNLKLLYIVLAFKINVYMYGMKYNENQMCF